MVGTGAPTLSHNLTDVLCEDSASNNDKVEIEELCRLHVDIFKENDSKDDVELPIASFPSAWKACISTQHDRSLNAALSDLSTF